MPDWVREGINGSAELAEVPSPTLEPCIDYFQSNLIAQEIFIYQVLIRIF